MNIHIFNPDHDIALAANVEKFTVSHSVRELRSDLGYIPALWAEDGDIVLVDDVEAAIEASRHLKCKISDVLFLNCQDLAETLSQLPIDKNMVQIKPWGWNMTLRRQLLDICESLKNIVPEDNLLETIRQFSNRNWASDNLLSKLLVEDERLVGKATYFTNINSVVTYTEELVHSVIKAPWSSSGRGLRYVDYSLSIHQLGWAKNIIERQGGIMVEPYYNKVKDFGMEFESVSGKIHYRGLSLFSTVNGAYSGNVIASEKEKMYMLEQYVPVSLINNVKNAIISNLSGAFSNIYEGPFGIDMMIVSQDGILKLHPCVEMNLRRTMGHVALAISPKNIEPQRLMSITYTNKYRMRVVDTHENVIRTTML